MAKILFLALFILFSMLGARCSQETEIGNPARYLRIQVVEKKTPTGLPETSSGINFSEAKVVLAQFEFDTPNIDCNATDNAGDSGGEDQDEPLDEDLKYDGPFVADLMNDGTIPDIAELKVPDGKYCEIDVTLDEFPTDYSPGHPLEGKTIWVGGKRADGVPFVLSAKFRKEFQIASKDGISIGPNGFKGIFMTFFLESWFDGVDLDSATLTDGTILIDETNNTDLLAIIIENIQLSTRLFGDKNRDGILDGSEQNFEDVLGEGQLIK